MIPIHASMITRFPEFTEINESTAQFRKSYHFSGIAPVFCTPPYLNGIVFKANRDSPDFEHCKYIYICNNNKQNRTFEIS